MLSTIKTKIEGLENAIDDFKRRFDKADERDEKLQAEVSAVREAVAELRATVKAVHSVVRDLQKRVVS